MSPGDRNTAVVAQVSEHSLHSAKINGLKGSVSVEQKFVGVSRWRDVRLDHLVVIMQNEFSRRMTLQMQLHHRAVVMGVSQPTNKKTSQFLGPGYSLVRRNSRFVVGVGLHLVEQCGGGFRVADTAASVDHGTISYRTGSDSLSLHLPEKV